MRGFLTLAAAFTLAAIATAQGWMLKAPYDAKMKLSWKVTVNASVGGQDHEAAMKQVFNIDSKTDKEVKGKASWSDLTVDGNQMGDDVAWALSLNPNGSIASAEDDDIARMLSPYAFVYPDKEVKVGDKWTAKFKPGKTASQITVDYEVLEETKVGDAPALRVKAKLAEEGANGMKADNIYWVGKDGKVLKFDLDVKNWTVPMSGNEAFDAKVHGELEKS